MTNLREINLLYQFVCDSYTMRDFPDKKKNHYPTALFFLEVQNSKLNLANWTLETPHDLKMFSIVTSQVRNISRLPWSVLSAWFSIKWYLLRENRSQSWSQNYYKLSFLSSYKWLTQARDWLLVPRYFWQKHFRFNIFFYWKTSNNKFIARKINLGKTQ